MDRRGFSRLCLRLPLWLSEAMRSKGRPRSPVRSRTGRLSKLRVTKIIGPISATRSHIDRNVINLNNGYVSPAPRPVQDAMRLCLEYSDMEPVHTMINVLEPEVETVRRRLAAAADCDPEEIAITLRLLWPVDLLASALVPRSRIRWHNRWFAYQRFSAGGLENFANSNFSIAPGNVTDLHGSGSFGAGFRVGWLGTLTQVFSLGVTLQSQSYMGRFDKYQGLFAEQGGFDIPANVGGGVALKLSPKATVLFDAERIFYGEIKAIANPDFPIVAPLGASNGPGFGWHDITAEKVGFGYKLTPAITLRASYNHSGLPFNGSQTFFNLLAPAVVQQHFTAGATWKLQAGKEINIAYQHAFQKTLNGSNSIPAIFGGGEANLSMYQDSIGVAFGWGK